jgi:signal transduction histidine kinase
MNDFLTILIAALVAATVAAPVAASRARRKSAAEAQAAIADKLAAVADSLRPGAGVPPTILTDTPAALVDIRSALDDAWVLRGQERGEAVEVALGRLSAFLRVAVQAPLTRALETDGPARREGVEDALGAIDDLDFFLEPPPEGGEPIDVRAPLKEVVAEFVSSWPDRTLRERIPEGTFNARINPGAFKDAVYLVLHNAAMFGAGGPIDVVLDQRGQEVVVIIRDKGPGFSADALLKALDPFYSTSEGGLGMGLPHAKRLIEGPGGAIRFRNMRKGGAEVTLALPHLG